MNTAKIYSQAIGRVPKPQLGELTPNAGDNSPTEELMKKQYLLDWRQNSLTVDMFRKMGDEVQTLVDQAIELALGYHQHNNHISIITLLIRANTIKKQIQTYAKHTSES